MGDKGYLKEVIDKKLADVKSEVIEAFREREEAIKPKLRDKSIKPITKDYDLTR